MVCVARHIPLLDVWHETWQWHQRALWGHRAEPAEDRSGFAVLRGDGKRHRQDGRHLE